MDGWMEGRREERKQLKRWTDVSRERGRKEYKLNFKRVMLHSAPH